MLYYKLAFAVLFLPAVMILYQIIPKKYRWSALLLGSMAFYSTFGVKIFIYPATAAVVTYLIGIWLEKLDKNRSEALKAVAAENEDGSPKSKDEIKKEKAGIKTLYTRRSRAALGLGVAALLLVLLYLKYSNFFIENINHILEASGSEKQFSLKDIILPLGISFYTMQAIGYMADVYWKKVKAERNPLKMLLFLSFFPTIVEGPIASYTDTHESLFSGEPLDPDNVIQGFIRLGWGVMKKLVIADRLYPAVNTLFDMSRDPHGAEIAAAAILFTVMEYMDFSGCMDMVVGCGRIFGVKLPENFKQPFFARNASEFWRRWHISLGVWFKTYIFYPVSMSGLAKKWGKFSKDRVGKHTSKMVASAMALLPVWLCNGLWHGPKWTYIFYGVFYFVIIMIELIFEPLGDKLLERMKLTRENKAVDIIRILRTWIVIFAGELFFRAETLTDGVKMFGRMFSGFRLSILWNGTALGWGLDKADWIVILFSLLIVIVVNVMREKGTDVAASLLQKPLVLRWALAFGLIFIVLIFGLYGPGYQEVDLIYAGF